MAWFNIKSDFGSIRQRSLLLIKATMVYKWSGNLRTVHVLQGHSKIELTVCDLGIEIEVVGQSEFLLSELPPYRTRWA